MSKIVLAVSFAAVTASVYFLFFSTSRQLEHATEKALLSFGEAVGKQDRAQVAAVLSQHITENAKIHLEVTFLSLTQNGRKPVVQDFGKKEFLTFIDNILYPLGTYSYEPQLTGFVLNEAKDAAEVTFTSREWADGTSHYGGVAVGVRFSSDTSCSAHVVFANKVPAIQAASCAVSMRSVPKPEEASKIQNNPAAMQEFLMR